MSVLDLNKIDKLDMKKEEDVLTAGKLVSDVYNNAQGFMERLAYVWDENIRFYMGDQHIYYNEVTHSFEVIPVTKYNRFIPRPVTNYILPAVNTMCSILTKNKPTTDINPNSRDPQDINAAKLAKVIQDVKWEDDEEQIKLVQSATIALLAGTVIRKDYWDSSLGPISKVTGEPIGDTCVEILDPFRFIPDVQNGCYYIETSVQPISWIKANYGMKSNGYTGLANKVKPDDNLSSMMNVFQRLKTSTGIADNGMSGKTNSGLTNCAVVNTCYVAPTQNHPNGLCIVVAGGLTLYVNKSPYYIDGDADSWHPYSFFKWNDVFFRWHGLSLVENLVPIQRRINAIDSLIILNRMTMVNPQWLLPKGCGIPEGFINGQPGLNIWYAPVGANGAQPQKIPGVGLPGDVYREREQAVKDLHEQAGDNQVLQGSNPTGVTTATQQGLMIEQSYSKFSPVLQCWEKFVERGQEKKLKLIASKYKENRPEFVKRMKALNRDNNEVEIKAFVGSDLRDNVSIKVESGSTLPRSTVVEQQRYMEAAAQGLLGPLDPVQNPIGNQKFLEKLGLSAFDQNVTSDVKKAKFCIGTMLEYSRGELSQEDLKKIMIMPYEMNPVTLQTHLQLLVDYMKTPNFEDPKGVFMERYEYLNELLGQLSIPQGGAMNQTPQVSAPPEEILQEDLMSSVPPEIMAQLTQAQGLQEQPGIEQEVVPAMM